MFNTKHNQFDLFFTVRPASIAIRPSRSSWSKLRALM